MMNKLCLNFKIIFIMNCLCIIKRFLYLRYFRHSGYIFNHVIGVKGEECDCIVFCREIRGY